MGNCGSSRWKRLRAIGAYKVVEPPIKLVFTFNMPQFSDLADDLTVEIQPLEKAVK